VQTVIMFISLCASEAVAEYCISGVRLCVCGCVCVSIHTITQTLILQIDATWCEYAF